MPGGAPELITEDLREDTGLRAHDDEPGAVRCQLPGRAPADKVRRNGARGHHEVVHQSCPRGPRNNASHCHCPHQHKPYHCAPMLCSEWAVNQHRDSLALYVGYDPLSQYFAVAENESVGRVKFSSLQAPIPLSQPNHSAPAHNHLARPLLVCPQQSAHHPERIAT